MIISKSYQKGTSKIKIGMFFKKFKNKYNRSFIWFSQKSTPIKGDVVEPRLKSIAPLKNLSMYSKVRDYFLHSSIET